LGKGEGKNKKESIMPIPVKVDLPNWAFNVAWKISELRYPHFQNRFKNEKLRKIHQNEPYWEHIESIMGYLGDIACAKFLGLDPKKIIKQMLIDTGCLKHRDTHDLIYNKCFIDVKIEDYNGFHNKVINGTILETEPYGCRLINQGQWKQNGNNIDYYVFGAAEYPFSKNYKLKDVKSIYLIGFLSHKDLEPYPFDIKTPANKKLHTPAKIIPNKKLKDINLLKHIKCDKKINIPLTDNVSNCDEILNELEKLWN
jgi:hypothetical protein